jgi:chromosome segregation ATPase
MAVFNVLFFMVSPELPQWQREVTRYKNEYTSEQQKLRLEREKLITLTTQVLHQSQTIETMTKKMNTCERTIETLTNKINTCERLNTQLMETNSHLRTHNTALHAENFQLRHAYQYLAHLPKTP